MSSRLGVFVVPVAVILLWGLREPTAVAQGKPAAVSDPDEVGLDIPGESERQVFHNGVNQDLVISLWISKPDKIGEAVIYRQLLQKDRTEPGKRVASADVEDFMWGDQRHVFTTFLVPPYYQVVIENKSRHKMEFRVVGVTQMHPVE